MLNKNKIYSIRWKLISTYLSLIFLILLIINIFLYSTFLQNNLNDNINFLKVQSTIIANQTKSYIKNLENNNKYSKEYIDSLIKKYSLDIDSRIMVLNKSGDVIIDSNSENINKNLNNINEVSKALEGNTSASHYRYNDKYLSYVASPIINNNKVEGLIFISSDSKKIYKEVHSTMNIILFISFISVIITGIISIFFANNISLPIVRLNSKVRKFYGIDSKFPKEYKSDELDQLETSFNLLTTKLKQVENRRKKFVSNVSHELRTPITSMKILSETIINGDKWDENIYREFMEDINSELNRLSNIIDDLLYLVDVEKEEINFNYELTSVNFLVRHAISTLEPIATKKGLKLNYIEEDKIQSLLDRSKFERVLINIIGNSIKYTEKGSVNVSVLDKNENFEILIQDTGIGIEKDDLPYIFDRFYKADKSRTYNKGSTGLGLSISQEIIELHNGRIEIDSEIHVGTEIKIFIPKKH